jgi:hypothetical protein
MNGCGLTMDEGSLDLTKLRGSEGDPLPEGRVLYIVYVSLKKKLPILR